jgi:hypothetical protein
MSDAELQEILRSSFELRENDLVDLEDVQLHPIGPRMYNGTSTVNSWREVAMDEVYEKVLNETTQERLITLGIKQGPRFKPKQPTPVGRLQREEQRALGATPVWQ